MNFFAVAEPFPRSIFELKSVCIIFFRLIVATNIAQGMFHAEQFRDCWRMESICILTFQLKLLSFKKRYKIAPFCGHNSADLS